MKIKTNLRQTKKRKRVRNSFLVPLSADSELQVYLVDEVKDQGEAQREHEGLGPPQAASGEKIGIENPQMVGKQ